MGTNTPDSRVDLRALVVDDEPMAREYLKLILTRIGGVQIVGECGEASECLKKAAETMPEVVFLDIHLPDESGMEAARSLSMLKQPPQLVFITGYDEYAVPAFDIAAVDYVMKPFGQERLEKTIARLRLRLQSEAEGKGSDSVASIDRLAIRDRDGCKLVDINDICYIRTQNRKTCIYTASQTHLSHYTLSELEHKLARHSFFRANEGCLVNLERVAEVVYYGPRTYELLLSEPQDTFVPLSRSRAQQLRGILGF